MDRERLDKWLEQGLLGLVCLVLILGPLLFGATGLDHFAILEGITAFALVIWAARFWTRDEYRLLWPPIAWIVPIFLGYVVWSYTQADVEYLARNDMNRVLLYGALFFLILDNFTGKEWTQILIFVAIFVGMGMSMYAIYQSLTQSHTILNIPQPLSYYGRAGGTFICPNHLASYLSMVLPLSIALTLMARLNPVLKVFLAYAAIVMLGGLFVTFSRAGYAAAAFGLIAMFATLIFNRDFRLKGMIALVIIVAPIIWFGGKSYMLQSRINKSFNPTGGFGDDRFNIWPSAVDIWREKFWTGHGPAQFDVQYRSHRPPLIQLQARPYRVHNDYLNTLADYGTAGLAIIFTALGAFWLGVVRMWRYVRRSNDLGSRQSTRAAIILGACAGLGAVLIHCIVEFNMHIPALAILVVTLMALVTGHWRFATERFWFRIGVIGRVFATLIVVTGAVWFSLNGLRAWREQRPLIQADKVSEFDEKHLALLRQGEAADPMNPTTPMRIGEILRRKAFLAEEGYEKVAEEAMKWFDRAMLLDPHDSRAFMKKGMMLDFLGRTDEAWPLFRQSMLLDPNSYYVQAHYGWHFLQLRAWRQAEIWFWKSLRLRGPADNPMAATYYKIANRKAEEEKAPITVSQPDPEPK
jgi:O-antigen ligase